MSVAISSASSVNGSRFARTAYSAVGGFGMIFLVTFLGWLTRLFISLAAGIGAGCATFGILAVTGDSNLYDIERMNRMGPPMGPIFLALGVGFLTIAIMFWLLSRKSLSAKAGPE
jgi:hypothetical protein